MDKIRHCLQAAAKKVADKCEKPLTLITSVAFLFVCIVLLPIAKLSIMANLLANAVIATTTLLLVLILAGIYGRDIRALRARLDEFAAELENIARTKAEDQLSPAEIQRIRVLIAEQAAGTNEDARRANRDRRPSLF